MDVNVLAGAEPVDAPLGSSDHPLRTIWHKSAPDRVRKAYRSGEDSKGWSAWTRHLAERDRPSSLVELLPGKRWPLLWAPPHSVQDSSTPDLVSQIRGFGAKGPSDRPSPEKVALEWLAGAAGATPDAGYALEALAWCHALPPLAGTLAPDVWWVLLDHLLGAVADAVQIEVEAEPLVHQMVAGELPFALGHLFPEITPCRKLTRGARRALSAGLVDLLDGQGLPHAKHLGSLRPLLACWTRCRALGDELPKGCWSKAAQTQYEWLVRNALRLTRCDGSHIFSGGPAGSSCEELFQAALRFGGDQADHDIAALILPGQRRASGKRAGKPALPDAATHSEWAAVGVLRPDWSLGGPRLTAAYPGQSVQIELESGRERLWSGVWQLEVRCQGELVPTDSRWEEICWVSDDDVDYLELEIPLRDGLRVQRQMLLAREDQFLMLADAILGERSTSLQYRGCLPVGRQISFQPAAESWEGFLKGRERQALVLPLALPEWRSGARVGSLVRTDRGLELCQSTRGRSMFAPLFFDLQPRCMKRRLTWRHLTVAENLEIQPNDVAVGYRVMVGSQQWLIYRSLARPGNRTLLGHNLTSEMLVARFERDGEVEPLLEIEPA